MQMAKNETLFCGFNIWHLLHSLGRIVHIAKKLVTGSKIFQTQTFVQFNIEWFRSQCIRTLHSSGNKLVVHQLLPGFYFVFSTSDSLFFLVIIDFIDLLRGEHISGGKSVEGYLQMAVIWKYMMPLRGGPYLRKILIGE